MYMNFSIGPFFFSFLRIYGYYIEYITLRIAVRFSYYIYFYRIAALNSLMDAGPGKSAIGHGMLTQRRQTYTHKSIDMPIA